MQYVENKLSDTRDEDLRIILLIGKIYWGAKVGEIEKELSKDFFKRKSIVAKFSVYLAKAKNELYTENEREKAFNNCYDLAPNDNNEELKSFLDNLNKDDTNDYRKLCEKYNKTKMIVEDEENSTSNTIITDETFLLKIEKASTKTKMNNLYKEIQKYGVILQINNLPSWEKFIKRSVESGTDSLLLELFKKDHFPQNASYQRNSDSYNLALAAVLKNTDIKNEIKQYVYENCGYEGFINIMKAYEIIGDATNCVKLFESYLKMCELLVL